MRMIDADALVEKSFCTAPATMNNPYGGDSVVLVDDIEKAPTIDPESLRPQGEWIFGVVEAGYFTPGGNRPWICSKCGEVQSWGLDKPRENYCPNCGAKMKGGTP